MKTWFITGTSRGFGRVWASAALNRGDRVAATARKQNDLAKLVERYGERVMPIILDVSDHDADLRAVDEAFSHFGNIDVVVNNAGYGLIGAAEELTEGQFRKIMDTNLMGAIWITQAAIPLMRKQGHGHIVQVSSLGGLTTSFPGFSAYNASKWALEGFSEAVSREIAGFGIKVTLVEPSVFATGFESSVVFAEPNPAYADMRKAYLKTISQLRTGDPNATAEAIFKIVDSEDPPLRVLLGSRALELMRIVYPERLKKWEEWEPVSRAADGPDL